MSVDPLVARVLVRRYGMDGRGPRSLERVARELGVPRARLRLLEAQVVLALKRLARRPLLAPSGRSLRRG